jgi:hypothetical protein
MNKRKNKPNPKLIKELASHFEEDFNSSLPIAVRKDGSIVYKDYVIKQDSSKNWAVYYSSSGDLVGAFFLKTCALMAAKAYWRVDIAKFHNIKELDGRYYASHMETQVCQHAMKKAVEYDRYQILLNKLELSRDKAAQFKDEISRTFKWSFV